MIFTSSNKNEILFFENENLGILTYNFKEKIAILYNHSKEKFVYKSSLEVVTVLKDIEEKDICRELYLITKNDFLKSRFDTPINNTFEFFVGNNNGKITHFATNNNYLQFCGVETINSINVKVIDTFNKEEDILKEIASFKDNDIYFYGFYDIKEDKISSSFLYKSLIQTRMCFGDFGKRYLSEGGLFLKFEII